VLLLAAVAACGGMRWQREGRLGRRPAMRAACISGAVAAALHS
jgi:hypothetical protein